MAELEAAGMQDPAASEASASISEDEVDPRDLPPPRPPNFVDEEDEPTHPGGHSEVLPQPRPLTKEDHLVNEKLGKLKTASQPSEIERLLDGLSDLCLTSDAARARLRGRRVEDVEETMINVVNTLMDDLAKTAHQHGELKTFMSALAQVTSEDNAQRYVTKGLGLSPDVPTYLAQTAPLPGLPGDRTPATHAQLAWLLQQVEQVHATYGFTRISTPLLESQDVMERPADRADGILHRALTFDTPHSVGKAAVRTSTMPSLARYIAARAKELALPVRWCSTAPCVMVTQPDGMFVQYHEARCDVVGEASPAADAEVMACVLAMFRQVGLTPGMVRVRVFSRGVLRVLLRHVLHIPPDVRVHSVCRALFASMEDDQPCIDALVALGLSRAKADRLYDTVLRLRTLSDLRDMLGERYEAVSFLTSVMQRLEAYGLRRYVVLDPRALYRAPSAYEDIVWEAVSVAQDKDEDTAAAAAVTVAAASDDGLAHQLPLAYGGRYDRFGAVPATGASVNVDALLQAVRDGALLPELPAPHHVAYRVVALDATGDTAAIQLAQALRGAGLRTQVALTDSAARATLHKWIGNPLNRFPSTLGDGVTQALVVVPSRAAEQDGIEPDQRVTVVRRTMSRRAPVATDMLESEFLQQVLGGNAKAVDAEAGGESDAVPTAGA